MPTPTSRTHPLAWHLRRAFLPAQAGTSDGQLLGRYAASRDEVAFEAIVRRHGPMVLGVCRRLLRDHHDAHDAFQATFLVLVKKAGSVVPPEMLPNWLYGVARQTAVRARAQAAKRKAREKQVGELPEPEARQPEPFDDLRAVLDEELARLPSKYRVAVVLCDLEGKSHKEAAGQLGWPVGTLASRLSRGRGMLAKRLARRGLAPSGGALTVLLAKDAAGCLPASLVSPTVRAGSLYWSGQAVVAGAIPAQVTALTEGVLKAMSLSKVKTVAAAMLLAGVVAFGGGILTRHTAADQPDVKTQAKPTPSASVAGAKERNAVAAATPKEGKDRLEVRADGKQVQVLAVFGGEEIQAVAGRMSYDEAGKLLVLEGNVRVRRRRAEEAEDIECKKMVIDRKAGTVSVEGAGGVRQTVPLPGGVSVVVPALGPVPVPLDFGFPVVKERRENEQVFNFFLGLTR